MRLAACLTALSCGLLLDAWAVAAGREGLGWPLAMAEAVAAITCGVLAATYWLRGPGRPVEDWLGRPGAPARLAWLALGPYRVFAGATLLVASRLSPERALDEVAPGFFVGRRPFSWERDRVAARGIGAVLDLCIELPSRLDRGPTGLPTGRCPILDGMPPTPAQFEVAVGWIFARQAEGRTILIHCAQGHGRSAIVAAVALVRLGDAADLAGVIEQIRQARPGARLSREQIQAAAAFLASLTSTVRD